VAGEGRTNLLTFEGDLGIDGGDATKHYSYDCPP